MREKSTHRDAAEKCDILGGELIKSESSDTDNKISQISEVKTVTKFLPKRKNL